MMPKVLIADDSGDNRYMLEALLQNNGFETISAANGEEALNLALLHRPGLIITDILMPVMDGYALCKQWKVDDRLKHIPFIFYTATYTDQRDAEFGLSLGADRFLIKPEDPVVILQVLKELLAESKSVDGLDTAAPPLGEEMEFFRQHNEVLFRKLEKKMAELEGTNAALQREIKERQQVEVALRESEEKLQTLLDASPVGIVWADMRHRIQYVNRKFVDLFGYTADDQPTLKEFFHLAYPDASGRHSIFFSWIESIEAAGQRGTAPTSFEASMACKDGRCRDVSINGAFISGLCLLVFTDITEQKQLKEQLQQSQKLESIGNLAGEIAHDFNNILTAVTGFASILEMKMAKSDPLLKYVNEITKTGMRGAALTHQLLAFSRKQLLDIKPLDINEMLVNLGTMLQRLIREDITLRFSLSETPLIVEADCLQLEQIVINLVTNARDAMPAGGPLTISTCAESIDPLIAAQQGIVEIGAGQFAVLRVVDNGLGMDDETRRRIFEPFFTTKETGKGTGLGLAVVYGIIRQHKGIIQVKSAPGSGTEFILYFPLLRGNRTGTAGIPRGGEYKCTGGSETILVAEDQEHLREMIKDILESRGYNVLTAEDGEAAIDAFKQQPERISLIIFDMMMPKKGGLDAFAEIAGISPGIKVLFVTGYGGSDMLREENTGGNYPILLKPYSSFDLLKRVRELLDGESP